MDKNQTRGYIIMPPRCEFIDLKTEIGCANTARYALSKTHGITHTVNILFCCKHHIDYFLQTAKYDYYYSYRELPKEKQ